jgi:dihydropteroate synthase
MTPEAEPGAEADFRVMGVINVTPDSFSDGGLYLDPAAAIAHGLALADEGAAILDVGGESTRPRSEPVPAAEELRRVLPVIEGLVAAGVGAQISVDTSKAAVAAAAVAVGATMVNDVTGFRADAEMASVVAASQADCVLMHMLGTPRTMQDDPRYDDDVVSEITAFLEERIAFAVSAGVAEERILVDPGIGFGKTAAHNLELINRIGELATLGRPVVIGTSRKSFLGRLTGRVTDDRLAGTIATNVLAYERGARVFRVHDVAPVHDALAVAAATVRAGCPSTTTATSSTTSTKM